MGLESLNKGRRIKMPGVAAHEVTKDVHRTRCEIKVREFQNQICECRVCSNADVTSIHDSFSELCGAGLSVNTTLPGTQGISYRAGRMCLSLCVTGWR